MSLAKTTPVSNTDKAARIAESIRHLNMIALPGQTIELRALDVGDYKSIFRGYYTDHDKLARDAAGFNGRSASICVTINPVLTDLGARCYNRIERAPKGGSTQDEDILCRRIFPLDFDPVRPDGVSSTDPEHEAALDRARQAREWLTSRGWPEPIYADSGNGAHLQYHIDLPNDDESKRLVENTLKVIGRRFSDEQVKVDTGVHNASRVFKLYGTLAAKGDDLENSRPHRWSRIIDAPDTLDVITAPQLAAVAALLPVSDPAPARTPSPHRSGDDEKKARGWLQRLASWRREDYAGNAWINVGMALSELGPVGLSLWEEWSQGSPKYEPGVCERKWRTFKPGAGLSLGSLAHWADEDDPGGARQRIEHLAEDDLNDAEVAGAELPEDDRLAVAIYVRTKNLERLADLCANLPRRTALPFLRVQLAQYFTQAQVDKILGKLAFGGDPLTDRIDADLARWGFSFKEDERDGVLYLADGTPMDDAISDRIKGLARNDGYGSIRGRPSLTALTERFRVLGRDNRFHPVRDWLNSLVWDGKRRFLDFAAHFEDAHTAYHRDGAKNVIFRNYFYRWMIGAVAKAMGVLNVQNGMVVLNGPQGIGKSHLAWWLASAIPANVFAAQPLDPDSTDGRRQLSLTWIWEVGELGSTVRRADRESLKHFLTLPQVTFRIPYATYPVTKPVLSSFIGTINNEVGFLTDPTGSRRFLTVELTKIDRSYSTEIDVSQLWAEIVHDWRNGETWNLSPAEQRAQRELNEAVYVSSDAREGILKYFEITGNPNDWIATIDIVQKLHVSNIRTNNNAVVAELRQLTGCAPVQRRVGDGDQRARGFVGVRERFEKGNQETVDQITEELGV